MYEFSPTLVERIGLEREHFRLKITHYDCSCIAREGYHGDCNPNVFLKPLTKVWDILIDGYDATNIVIVNESNEKHVCNKEGNCSITKLYTCQGVNDTFFLYQLWSCMLLLNGVSDVMTFVKQM